jgi:drug/metabolite transporter (DMT)-like permease
LPATSGRGSIFEFTAVAHLYFSLICLIWGASFILMERASHAFGPVEIALCRSFIGAAVLGILWWWSGTRFRIRLGDIKRIAIAGTFSTAIPFIVQPFCVSLGFGHSYFGILVSFLPLMTLVVSVPMLGTWPTGRQLVGVFGGLVCMWAIMADGTLRGISPRFVAIFMLVPICSAIGNALISKWLTHIPILPLATLILFWCGILLLPFQYVPPLRDSLGFNVPTAPHDWSSAIAALATFILFGTCVALLLYFKLIREQGPLFAGMVTYVLPVLSLFWGRYDHELITLREVVAIAGVLGTVALVQFGAASPVEMCAIRSSESTQSFDSESPVSSS